MTPEGLAVVRAFLNVAAAKDYAGLKRFLEPDSAWFGTRGGLDEQRVVRGADAWISYLQEIEDPWQRFDFDMERIVDIDDTIVVLLRETAQSRHAGLQVQDQTAMIFKVAGHKVVKARGYLDRDEAFAAAREDHWPE